ncbi:hypothetical protein [Burkholderia gladioli]|uniref:hypothetical protein n=1 Tax=Burkholderia gladioli TaxID=28095 RepID=UPI0016422D77|nr:hypothetical protein [Burkholderia gladioli]
MDQKTHGYITTHVDQVTFTKFKAILDRNGISMRAFLLSAVHVTIESGEAPFQINNEFQRRKPYAVRRSGSSGHGIRARQDFEELKEDERAAVARYARCSDALWPSE